MFSAGISSELRSFFCTRKLKILQSVELPVDISEHKPESPTVGRSENLLLWVD